MGTRSYRDELPALFHRVAIQRQETRRGRVVVWLILLLLLLHHSLRGRTRPLKISGGVENGGSWGSTNSQEDSCS